MQVLLVCRWLSSGLLSRGPGLLYLWAPHSMYTCESCTECLSVAGVEIEKKAYLHSTRHPGHSWMQEFWEISPAGFLPPAITHYGRNSKEWEIQIFEGQLSPSATLYHKQLKLIISFFSNSLKFVLWRLVFNCTFSYRRYYSLLVVGYFYRKLKTATRQEPWLPLHNHLTCLMQSWAW